MIRAVLPRALAPLGALLIVFVALPKPSSAQDDQLVAVQAGEPAVLVLSGGVSLGTYEAGYLYALTEASKASKGRFNIPLLTGASAGSANAFLSAINLCSPPNDRPSRDLGWLTWLPMDYRSLFDKSAVTAENVLSRKPLMDAFELVRARWHQGLPKSCDVVVGVTVTRLMAERITVRQRLLVPRQEEKFAFRIRGRGMGRPPRLTNYVNPHATLPQPLLPFEEDDGEREGADRNLNIVRSLLFASAAFPIAFSPVQLTYCMSTPDQPPDPSSQRPPCSDDRLLTDTFIDGGVFDNNPLRLAQDLSELGLVTKDDQPAWLEPGADLDDADGRRSRPTFLYLDPDTLAFPPVDEAVDESSPKGVLRLASRIGADFVATARGKELYNAVRQNPFIADQTMLTLSNYPLISGEIGAFMGFFDREFRRFDFYLGMFDALVQSLRAAPEQSSGKKAIEAYLAQDADSIVPEWRPLTCMFSYYRMKYAHFRPTCEGDDLQDFRILLQVTLDRVYSHCGRLPSGARRWIVDHPHCEKALDGHVPPRVPGVEAPEDFDYQRTNEETTLDHVLRLLSQYEFRFKDLGLDRDESQYGRIKVRRKLLGMIEHIAEAQDDRSDRALLLSAGRSFVNNIAYEPPKDWWYVSGGSAIEVGASLLPFEWNESWARLHIAAQFVGAETLFAPDPIATRLSLTAGGEFEPLFITTPLVQPILGVRAGWQFANRDVLGTEDCNEDNALGDNRNCSQFVVHSYFALGIVERLRLQLTIEWFPIDQDVADDNLYDVQFGFGFQFF